MKKHGRHIACLAGLVVWMAAIAAGIRYIPDTGEHPVRLPDHTPQEQLFCTSAHSGLAGTVHTLRLPEHHVNMSRPHSWECGTAFCHQQLLRQHSQSACNVMDKCAKTTLRFPSTDIAYPFDVFW